MRFDPATQNYDLEFLFFPSLLPAFHRVCFILRLPLHVTTSVAETTCILCSFVAQRKEGVCFPGFSSKVQRRPLIELALGQRSSRSKQGNQEHRRCGSAWPRSYTPPSAQRGGEASFPTTTWMLYGDHGLMGRRELVQGGGQAPLSVPCGHNATLSWASHSPPRIWFLLMPNDGLDEMDGPQDHHVISPELFLSV